MKTSETNPIDVNFLERKDHGLAGRIGVAIAPGKKDPTALQDRDLELDLARLRNNYETGLLVSLLEPAEYEMLGIPKLPGRASAWGIENVRFAIPDFGAPPATAMGEFLDLVKHVVEAAQAGKTVVIHCRGGGGRSGTLAACCLVSLGHEANEAIECVRRVRPGAIRVEEQIQWVEAVAADLKRSDHPASAIK